MNDWKKNKKNIVIWDPYSILRFSLKLILCSIFYQYRERRSIKTELYYINTNEIIIK